MLYIISSLLTQCENIVFLSMAYPSKLKITSMKNQNYLLQDHIFDTIQVLLR